MIKTFLYSWITCFTVGLSIDFVWLNLMASRFYKFYLGHLFGNEFKYMPALIFYIIYSGALAYLIILPSLQNSFNINKVIVSAFIFGLAAYGAYDLTNHATLRDWPLLVTVVDMFWGATVTALTSGISYTLLTRYLL